MAADTDSGNAASQEERDAAAAREEREVGAAGRGIFGDTGAEVIGGTESGGAEESAGRDVTADPDLDPISGGDVSETPAAHGTRGTGTGADMGTGGEVGTTLPGSVAASDQTG